uniref:Apolipoprotein L n=1 Tax=Pygocentrus nattereri TaxID=42514 RepID=A0AAR2LRK7_PYGNA
MITQVKLPSSKRLEEQHLYILTTLTYIDTVKDFCDTEPNWTCLRESEIKKMRNIKRRTDKTKYLRIGRQKLEKKLEKELGEVLRNTLEGLEKLHHFLDAVEKLAVTSPFVFTDEVSLTRGVSPATVRSVILTARTVSPLLIHFKRDDGAFFLPSLHNLDILAFQLEKYIRITQELCMSMNFLIYYMWKNRNPSLRFNSASPEFSTYFLSFRMDESFRLTYLFGENTKHFFETYSGCRSRMIQFLSDLEETAVELDKMKKGSSISTVAGSSVGAVGSVFSIVGLALAPVTAGVSLGLTLTGVGLRVTSGANSLVTGFTEYGVNMYHRNKANSIFTKMMEDVQKVLDCLENAASSECPRTHLHLDYIDLQLEHLKMACRTRSLLKRIFDTVDGPLKTFTSEKVIRVVGVGLQEGSEARSIPSLAADLPDIGRLAKGTPLAMSKLAMAKLIGLNIVSIGMDLGFIYKGSKSLANKETSEDSQFIRSRSALLRSEIEAWDKIYDTLKKRENDIPREAGILEQHFPIIQNTTCMFAFFSV